MGVYGGLPSREERAAVSCTRVGWKEHTLVTLCLGHTDSPGGCQYWWEGGLEWLRFRGRSEVIELHGVGGASSITCGETAVSPSPSLLGSLHPCHHEGAENICLSSYTAGLHLGFHNQRTSDCVAEECTATQTNPSPHPPSPHSGHTSTLPPAPPP